MKQIDIEEWVNQESANTERDFREAVHTILYAISNSNILHNMMIMKGGILLAIRHHVRRYTKDIDFSTDKKYQEFDKETFLKEFKKQLTTAVVFLDYDLDCRLQSVKIKPSDDPDRNFHSLKLTIGFASKGSSTHKHLLKNKSPKTVPIDFSFNERTDRIEEIKISDKNSLLVYSLADLIAEKFRAMLQQEVRNRIRRQDVYDLYTLFQMNPNITDEDKKNILETLISKSAARGLSINRDSLNSKEIRDRSKKEYALLKGEIEGELVPFDKSFPAVKNFYQSLPWK